MNFIWKFTSGIAAGTLVIAVLIFSFIIGPVIFLWSLNTLFEQAGSSTYIPHNFFTYLACYGIFLIIKLFSTETNSK